MSVKVGKGIILSLIMLLLFLCGCGYSDEEKVAMKQYEEQGRENAETYIKEKYGFTAKIEDVKCDKIDMSPIPDFWPGPNGNVRVTMTHKGQEFYVYISGEEKTNEGVDNYQAEEITVAFEKELLKVTGLKPEECFLYFGRFEAHANGAEGNGMLRTYYDGSNLDEVLHEGNFKVLCSYIGEDMSGMSRVKDAFGEGEYLFVSYNSAEDFQMCDDRTYNILGTPIASDIEKNELFVQEYYCMEYEEEAYVKNEVRSYDNFFYTVEDGSDVQFEETDIDDPENWNGRGYLGAKQVMKAYRIITQADKVRIYIPCDSIKKGIDNPASIALQYKSDGEVVYKGALTFKTGKEKYLVATIYMRDYEDMIFTVLESTK